MSNEEPMCNGEYAKTLPLPDRYFYCENCRKCKLSDQLPDWDETAKWSNIVNKLDELYPHKLKIWFDESNPPTIKQYPTIKEMIEDACGISYIAGLNDYGVRVQVFERGETYGTMSHL